MHPDVEQVPKGKNLLLFKKLLQESGYPDVALFDDLHEIAALR